MKRQKQNNKHSKTKKKINRNRPQLPKNSPSRRNFFQNIRNGAIATVVVGGGVWFVVDDVMATLDEQDLTKIGNGIPTIVQIHDPQCSQCIALQRETRKALENFDNGKLQYLVANIKSAEGRTFAATHHVRHVTLLLFDSKGKRRQILIGPNQSDYLTDVFRQHLEKFGRS